jgi:hypothetical protein
MSAIALIPIGPVKMRAAIKLWICFAGKAFSALAGRS